MYPCHRSAVRLLVLIAIACALATSGCTTTPAKFWDSLKGEGFTGWSESMGAGGRGNKDAKSSGVFADRRSEQIEKDLGGF
jgi:hypothetical protein